jgi:hypothetical protein
MTTVVMAAAMAILTTGGRASASPARAAARTKPPTKVTSGSVWALHLSNSVCYTETFAADHAFSDTNSDSGIYRGSIHLRMKWKTGPARGDVFSGQWSRTTGNYSGFYAHTGLSDTATLDPVLTGPCTTGVPVNA